MQTWLFLGLLAALFYGGSAIAAKATTSQGYFGLSSSQAAFLMLVGIGAVFIANLFLDGGLKLPQSPSGIGVGILAGVLWGLGMVVTFRALAGGADIARLAPIYNTNTLVAVILGIVLLGELPSAGESAKVILGAVLILVGSVLVSS